MSMKYGNMSATRHCYHVPKQDAYLAWTKQINQDNRRRIIVSTESGPRLFTLGIMFAGDTNLTHSLSSVKLLCSLYGTSYLDGKAIRM